MYSNLGAVYIFGDFNSRVGQKNDCIKHDKINLCMDDIDYTPDSTSSRASIDVRHNNHGIKLLDLCIATGLRIVNGRLGNSNNYTFLSHNGCSVIDYLLTCDCNFAQIINFTIGSLTKWSDHAPLLFSLQCNNVISVDSSFTETKFKWNEQLRDQFRSGVIANLSNFNEIVNNTNCTDRLSVDSMLSDFTNILQEIANPLFSKKCFYKESTYFYECKRFDTEWFDTECKIYRDIYINALNSFNNEKSELNRINLCECKSHYKQIIRKKKNANFKKQMRELERMKNSQPKDFWKHFKSFSSKNSGNITLNDFRDYFMNLGGNLFHCVNEDAENFNINNDFNIPNTVYPELDNPITTEEIITAVKSLKRNKAYGCDNLLNEYFIETIDILSGHLCEIFNKIIDSGFSPRSGQRELLFHYIKKVQLLTLIITGA